MLSSLPSLAPLSPIFELADLSCLGYTWASCGCTFGLQCEYTCALQLHTIKVRKVTAIFCPHSFLLRIETLIQFSILAEFQVAEAAESAVPIQKLLLKPLLTRYMIFFYMIWPNSCSSVIHFYRNRSRSSSQQLMP